jgi:hypothetical protein
MKPDRCSFCKGKLYEGKTEFAYFTPKISRKIDEVMKAFHKGGLLARPIAAGEVEIKV